MNEELINNISKACELGITEVPKFIISDKPLDTKYINNKLKMLHDFGIKNIPDDFLSGIKTRSQLDIRAKRLISRRLVIADFEEKKNGGVA